MTTTNIDIEYEKDLVTESLKHVCGYLDCEKLIIQHTRKHLELGIQEDCIESYLKALIVHIESATIASQNANEQLNHRFVIGFIYTLLRTPSWRSWVQTIQI